MGNIFKLAVRNLFRYKRRTMLTSMLITLGVVSVLCVYGWVRLVGLVGATVGGGRFLC